MNNKIKMFETTNNTSKWVIAANGYCQMFETLKEATDVYGELCAEEDCVDNTIFGSLQLMEPGYVPVNRFDGSNMTKTFVADVVSVDLIQYRDKYSARMTARLKNKEVIEAQKMTAKERLDYVRKYGCDFDTGAYDVADAMVKEIAGLLA